VVKFKTNQYLDVSGKLPSVLNDIVYFKESDKSKDKVRKFNLDMEDGDGNAETGNMMSHDIHHMFTINGKSMDMNRIDERVKKGDLELWVLTADMMPHPFHIHGVSFQILSHHGNETQAADKGWKDTVVISDQPTEVLMRFNHEADQDSPYMYHCHILEHEDGGMMGQFTVQ